VFEIYPAESVKKNSARSDEKISSRGRMHAMIALFMIVPAAAAH
jgi:hypothetical protein